MTFKEICGLGMWTQHSQNYVKAALPTIEEAIEHGEYDIPMKAKTPFSTKYCPELDTTPEIDANHTRLCLEWVGILRWAVELGRLDMYLEVSLISSQIANPRCGHLKEILHIFAHLKRRNKLTIALPLLLVLVILLLMKNDSELAIGKISTLMLRK